MAVTLVDSNTAAPATGVLTFAASLVGATAPNALLWVIGGDKNSGTVTPPTDTPTFPINLKGTGSPADQVTLAMAHGTADGGETTLSGTVGANVAGGQVWVAELADSVGTGVWARWGTVLNETAGADVTTVALDNLAATETGLAIAAVAADSVNTQGTVAWTSSTGHTFTARRATASGGGQAGLWIATAPVTKGDTVSVTFARTGGTADQHSGFMTVMARTVSATTGSLAATLQKPTSALTGLVRIPGALGATLQRPVGALQGSPIDRAALAASVALPVAALAGLVRVQGQLGATMPPPIANIAGIARPVGALAAVLPLPVMFIHEALPVLTFPLRAGQPTVDGVWAAGVAGLAPTWSAGPAVLG
jgi:hypothetical protein